MSKKHPDEALVKNEYKTGQAYHILGVPTSQIKLYHDKIKGLTLLSKRDPGVSLKEYLQKHSAEPEKIEEMKKKLRSHFVADCLLANWDVIGQNKENIWIDESDRPVRTGMHGGLFYTAGGSKKSGRLSNDVSELETMRDPLRNPAAAEIFSGITDAEISTQIDDILKKKAQFLSVIPNAQLEIMKGRIQYLENYKKKLNLSVAH